MGFPDRADDLLALSLADPEYLLFCPSGDKAWLREKMEDIPRYLFRLFTPKSSGTTDRSWTKSVDARYASKGHKVDVFARDDNRRVASMLNAHLRWWQGDEDNFVSWTSSLLFVLIYCFHLHANIRNGSAFDDIFLCIIDTTRFPSGVFLQDMYLIEAYLPFDATLDDRGGLRSLKGLRSRKDMYFGEYLSQGALKIEGKCQIVSAQAMIDQGLCNLRYPFEDFAHWQLCQKPPWASEVVSLRKELFWIESPVISKESLQIAINIAKLFGSCWTLPVAASLIALLPGPKDDVAVKLAFRAKIFTGLPLLPKRRTQADMAR